MTPAQVQLFDQYWTAIRRVETFILENGHRPCPLDAEDRWDLELEDVYDAIHPLLVCLSKPQLFVAVSSLPNRRGVFKADNAHQGLMFGLNPPEALFGDSSQLESNHYIGIRTKAETEVARLAAMNEISVAVPVVPRVGAEVWDDDYTLRWELPSKENTTTIAKGQITDLEPLSYRLSKTMEMLLNSLDEVPRTAEKLAIQIDCEFQTARKYLPRLVDMRLARRVRQGYVRNR